MFRCVFDVILRNRYLQEIGYTDTIIDVRSNRVRSLLGLGPGLGAGGGDRAVAAGGGDDAGAATATGAAAVNGLAGAPSQMTSSSTSSPSSTGQGSALVDQVLHSIISNLVMEAWYQSFS